ncbi:LysR substrate-binding domain-containing protein [Massilia sp. TS11]|uniref:LysR substrate-binding domain-containing protein n=1 Tax=Massilia sp. TS11 TaxID=2908003 RepID=UPI001EDA357E|nr:LysR substrate-binding domain-containing protein [Massilia sp. TS11]MCG2585608.1 LysR substrate-binding domain-containing protein [Massilia sp. TS11]
MRKVIFDLDALRTLRVGIELGSFAQAADRLNRSTSAVSAQLKKLEEQAGTPILRKVGRGLQLTDAGEILLRYARRMLDLNEEAALALGSLGLAGTVRLGLQEDFGENLLSDVLGGFARSHPAVHIEARIARNAELVSRMQTGDLDLALAWEQHPKRTAHSELVGTYALRWIAAEHYQPSDAGPIPIVAMDAPCLLRKAATDALDAAGIPWKIVFTSPSLAGVWAAVAAGLGLTVRTHFGLPPRVRMLDPQACALPVLGSLDLVLHSAAAGLNPAATRLRTILLDRIGEPSQIWQREGDAPAWASEGRESALSSAKLGVR